MAFLVNICGYINILNLKWFRKDKRIVTTIICEVIWFTAIIIHKWHSSSYAALSLPQVIAR